MRTTQEHANKINEIYWIAHLLFFLLILGILFMGYAQNGQYFNDMSNILWAIACLILMIVNVLYLKAIREKYKQNRHINHQLMYSLTLIVLTFIFSRFLQIDVHALQFIYLFFIILVSLTCTLPLAIGTTIILSLENALISDITFQCIWVIFLFHILMAWLIGSVSQVNLGYARKLEHERKFLTDIIEAFSCGVIITNTNGVVTLCNGRAAKILGLKREDMIGKKEDAIIKALGLPHSPLLQESFTNMEIPFNEGYYLVSRLYIQKDEQYTVTLINDITELTNQKKQIEDLKMLSAIGELAGGVAHEVRNPLTTIRGYIQLTEGKIKDTPYYAMSKMALEELDRINGIIEGLMQMTPRQPEEFQTFNLNDLINKVWDLYTCEGQSKGITYRKDLFNPLPTVYGNPKQIQQVLLNLMQNAEKACPNGGEIIIKTYVNYQEYICFDIIDNGIGIAPGELDKITLPFYSKNFSGTGFGLPLCQKIISEHHGVLKITSKPGEGTVVTVKFPQS